MSDSFPGRIRRFFSGGGRPGADLQYPVASLLAAAASSDGSVSTEETERLVVILRRGFELDAGIALELVVKALHDLAARDGIDEILAELGRNLNAGRKEDLIVMLLEVISADGVKEAEEMDILARTVDALGVPDRNLRRAYTRYFDARRAAPD